MQFDVAITRRGFGRHDTLVWPVPRDGAAPLARRTLPTRGVASWWAHRVMKRQAEASALRGTVERFAYAEPRPARETSQPELAGRADAGHR